MTINWLSKTLMIWILVLGINSCVTQKRCFKKFPPKVETIIEIKDTTIITETTQFDTTFILDERHDTMYFHDTITDIKVKFIKIAGDTIKVLAECPPDTIQVEKEVIKTITIVEEYMNYKQIGMRIFWVLVIGFCIVMVYKFLSLWR